MIQSWLCAHPMLPWEIVSSWVKYSLVETDEKPMQSGSLELVIKIGDGGWTCGGKEHKLSQSQISLDVSPTRSKPQLVISHSYVLRLAILGKLYYCFEWSKQWKRISLIGLTIYLVPCDQVKLTIFARKIKLQITKWFQVEITYKN